MNELDFYALAGFILRLIALGLILFYIVPRAIIEVLRPKDWLTGLRWRILAGFSFVVTASAPGIVYQVFRIFGIEADPLRNLASISGNLSFLAFSISFVMVYMWKKKD